MKTVRYIVLILLWVAGIQGVSAQLHFAPDSHDFGTINEVDGSVHCSFTGVNRSKKPIVVVHVESSCGCTVPEYSRKPILPGDSTRIEVTFDPTGRSGVFTKDLGIFNADRKKVAELHIYGTIVPRPKRVEELYPIDAGSGLRLTDTGGAYAYAYPGKPEQCVVEMINTSAHALTVDVRPAKLSGLVRVSGAQTLLPNETGTLTFLCEIPADKPYYGRFIDEWTLYINGRATSMVLITNGIGVDNPDLLPANRIPKAQTSVGEIRLGAVRRGEGVVRREFELKNVGKGPLLVRQVEAQGVTTDLSEGAEIPAGASVKVVVLFDPSAHDYGFISGRLTFITNDPSHPMRWIRILGTVEE